LIGDVEQRALSEPGAGVAVEDVEPTVAIARSCDERIDECRVGDVTGMPLGSTAHCLDHRYSLGDSLLGEIVDEEGRTLCGQAHRARSPDARACAGDDRDPAV
jgi:hypothetical protein